MFPREITNTSVWIRHQLPLHAPSPRDGDRKLRRQIRSQYQHETEEEINEIVQKERARLNLKWCFDEYFGSPITHPTLGEIVTANVFGNVYLGYIVDVTRSSIILVSIDTLTVLTAVNHEDIYSGKCSPFFENYLHDHRVYHPQHVLDWWSRSKYDKQLKCTNFSPSTGILSPIYTDIISDWPEGNEIWFTHDVLPQRSEFIHCHEEEIIYISTKNTTENAQQHPISLPDLSPVPTDQTMCTAQYSNPYVMITDQRSNSSVQINIPDTVITHDSQLSHSNLYLRKQSHLRSSPVITSGFVCQHGKLTLFSLLLICLIMLSHSVKPRVESSSLTLDPELVLDSLFIYNFYAQPLVCSLTFHDSNNRDWFRTLAVP